MPSSNIIRDGHVHVEPFIPQEADFGALHQSTISSNVIRASSAVPVRAFPLFQPSSDPAATTGTVWSVSETETEQNGPASPCETQQPVAMAEGVQEEVGEEAAAAPECAESAALLQQAREEAERCLAEARQRAEAIETEAYQAGFRQGEAAAREEIRQQFASALASFQHVTEEVATLRQKILRQAEEDVVTLAFHLARKIIQQEILRGREVLAATLRRALELLVDRDTVVVRVNPADLELAQELQGESMHAIRTIRHLTIEGDETVGRGGCVVESAFGEIDARIESQLAELEQRFRERYSQVSEAGLC
jgi:flagellar assembly protein FliH